MHRKINYIMLLFSFSGILLISCQKEITDLVNGNINPANQKPKLGTLWTYRYYTYYAYGGVATSGIIMHKAKTEETIGGEKWLNIVDVNTDTTVYLLNEKTGGLYQYTNNASYLFCKNPASVNDAYTTFFEGGTEDFIVKAVKDTLPTGIGDIPVNYYEGYRGTQLVDLLWYNTNAWIVRKIQYRKPPLGTLFYKYSALFIDNIVY